MKRYWLGVVAAATVSACSGGYPWAPVDETQQTDPVVPAAIAGDMQSFTYNPVAKTLVVRGVTLDDTPFEAVYSRAPALDRPGYEAYSSQESSLSRHTTAYVQQIDGTRAAIAVSGGQFGHFFGGSSYGRDGSFDPPGVAVSGGLVSYAGNYIGLLNVAGDGGDLLPVAPGTPNEVRPKQAAEVTGSILITADFADMSVNGIVYDRVAVDAGAALEDLELAPGDIAANGTFAGKVTQNGGTNSRGDYGGLFGGTNSSAVAGTLHATDHISGITNPEEYGLFVLGQCGTPGADPLCNQPVP